MSPHNRLREQQRHTTNHSLKFILVTCFSGDRFYESIRPGVVKAYGMLDEYTEWKSKGQRANVCARNGILPHSRGHLTLQLPPSLQRINTDNGEWFKFPSPQCHSPVCHGSTASVPRRYTCLPRRVTQRSRAAPVTCTALLLIHHAGCTTNKDLNSLGCQSMKDNNQVSYKK